MINKNLKEILFLNGRNKFFSLIIITFIGSIFDALSVASMFPVVLIITSPLKLLENEHLLNVLNFINKYMHLTENEILVSVLSICAFIIIISTFIKYKYIFDLNDFISRLQHNMILVLVKKQINKSYEFFVKENSTNLTNTIVMQIDKLSNLYIRNLFNIIVGITSIILIFIFLFYVSYVVALLSIIILSFLFLSLYFTINKNVRLYGKDCTIQARKLNRSVGEIYRGIKAIKLLPTNNHYLKNVEISSDYYRKSFFKCILFQSIPSIITEPIVYVFIIISVFTVILFSQSFQLEIINLLPIFGVYTIAVMKIKPHVSSILVSTLQIKSAIASAEFVFKEFRDCKDIKIPTKIFDFKSFKFLKLNNLKFKYTTSENDILADLNISIQAGDFIGIAGATGAGKSTLMDILLGLLEPTDGSFMIDDVKINFSNVHHLQSIIGYVPQDIFLSDTTIAENIVFGQNTDCMDKDFLKKVADISLVSEFVDDLPSGFYSSVGETGVCLSGGQKQRIGLARALYLKPTILILDEATSALDSITEKKILSALNKINKSMTIIMVTHRLPTLSCCDKVIYLSKGRISFQGTYNQFVTAESALVR